MDENKRKSLAFFVCFFLFLLWLQMVWTPFRQNLEPVVAPVDTAKTEAATTPGAAQEVAAAQSAPRADFPNDQELKEKGQIFVETDKYRAKISLLGGRLLSLELKDYKQTVKKKSPLLNLVQHVMPQGSDPMPYPLGINSGEQKDSWVEYSLHSVDAKPTTRFSLNGAQDRVFTLHGTLPDGRSITKEFHFYGDKYFVDLQVATGPSAGESVPLEIEWNQVEAPSAEHPSSRLDSRGFTWFDGNAATRELMLSYEQKRAEAELAPNGRQELGPVSWISEGDRYFGATFIAIDAPDGGKNTPRSASIFGSNNLHGITLSGAGNGTLLTRAYLGPKSYTALEEMGYRMELNVNFGLLSFFSVPLLMLLQFLYGILHNYGLAIIALTIIVKSALFRLTAAQLKQMTAMQALKPEMDRIKSTITDKQKQQTELMALYKKKGVNPLGGCLPMLVQMPIFIALFYTLQEAIELRHSPFIFWIKDLSAPEQLMVFGVGIPLMVILFAVSMLVQQWIQPTPGMDPIQKKMMMVMPIILGFMFINFPAGLTLYWLTNNLISIGQTQALRADARRSAILVTTAVSVGVFLFAVILVVLSHYLT